APSARATSAATGTPPRGSASTTTSSPRKCSIRLASRLPASDRSRNGMVIASVLSQSVYPAEATTEAMVPRWLPPRNNGSVQWGRIRGGPGVQHRQGLKPAGGGSVTPGSRQPGSGQQGAHEGTRAGGVLAASVLAGHEVGDARLGQGADLGADGVLVADDGH